MSEANAVNCLIIAGEKSGEEHCLSFFDELKQNASNTKFWGVGGDDLKSRGVELLYHLKDFSTMGFGEVVSKIFFYKNALNKITEEVEKRKTKHAILIDFQGFNFRLAKRLKERGVNVLYYVAPQAWAWKEWRAKALSDSTHTIFSIIPFEKEWFRERGVQNIVSVSHPILKRFDGVESKKDESNEIRKILLLPGSRNSEVKYLLPDFIKSVREIRKSRDIEVSIVTSSSVNPDYYRAYEKDIDSSFTNEELAIALNNADFCFASSGTVTLSCALFNVPTIVCYKISLFNEFIVDSFVGYRGPYALVNIINQEMVFPELMQNQSNSYEIVKNFFHYVNDSEFREATAKKLKETARSIKGDVENVGELMANILKEGTP